MQLYEILNGPYNKHFNIYSKCLYSRSWMVNIYTYIYIFREWKWTSVSTRESILARNSRKKGEVLNIETLIRLFWNAGQVSTPSSLLATSLNINVCLTQDGQLWLCAPQAKQIWHCLAENAVFTVDREACFKWFSKLMGDEPDLDPDINKEFFENNILLLDPHLLTEHGIRYVLTFLPCCGLGLPMLKKMTNST